MKIHRFKNSVEASEAVADRVCLLVKRKPNAVLGLPTGKTPMRLYEALVARQQRGEINLRSIRTFNLDEFVGIPPSHPASFHEYMKRYFTTPLGLANSSYLPTDSAAYEKAIVDAGGLDLTVVGLGRNGHVGFNEPGSDAQLHTHVETLTLSTRQSQVEAFEELSNVPLQGITMGLGTILQSKAIFLLAFGKEKSAIVKKTLEEKISPAIPASQLRRHKKLEVFLDADSACELMETFEQENDSPSAMQFTKEELAKAQTETLSSPRRTYGILARILFRGMDLFYGKSGTLRKFRALEVIARMPYQAWENVAYVAITHVYTHKSLAMRIFERVQESRQQQDNEQWHLLILTELMQKKRLSKNRLLDSFIPQIAALFYYHISWILFVIKPSWSYNLNADFEDHAEHEYMAFVRSHSEFEKEAFESQFEHEYGKFSCLADVLRQIGYDERMHKLESLARATEPRFR